MCVFSRSEQIEVIGLLPNKDSFPIPIEDEFGGDVLIGYRSWKPTFNGLRPVEELYSRHFLGTWLPGRPFEANGIPSTITGRGIYAYAEEPTARGTVRGKVAVWGRALDFESNTGSARGCMGQYAYPLELWVAERNPELFKAWPDTGVHIYRGLYGDRERVL